MPFPEINLDDRRFQDIVDEARRLIPRYTPEWTDHNASDPGITLIELFAWMTEMVLYRTNQVPDKVYYKLLELIGAKLEPPRAAQAPVTFYLSAAQDFEINVPEGAEVATLRTETTESVIFSTEKTLVVRPPKVLGAFSSSAELGREGAWIVHDLRRLELAGNRVRMFGVNPTPGDAFYVALEGDHSDHVIALDLQCEVAGGAGIDPTNPPLEWQVWQGNIARWVPCEVDFDATGGFNVSGEVILHLPKMVSGVFQGLSAHWLRVRLTEPNSSTGAYKVSPDLEKITLESRGGTVIARHAITVLNEFIGESDGTPGQLFSVGNVPVLARDPKRDYLVVEEPGAIGEKWTEVPDFGESHEDDLHFTLDDLDGTITLGPALLQTTGNVYKFGKTPAKGAQLRFSRYQYGGGVLGNVPKGALQILKTSIPYIARTINRSPAMGGANAQSLEEAKLKAPQMLRTRWRAVTVDDFEYLGGRVPGVGRVKCLGSSEQPGKPGEPKPGQVVLLIVPEVDNPAGRITPEAMTLSAELRSAVMGNLNERRLVGTTLDVRSPQYQWISVQAKLRLTERANDPIIAAETRDRAEAALYAYLNPFTGGPRGEGWGFGRDLHQSELHGVLQRIPGVEFVEEVTVGISVPGSTSAPTPAPARLKLARDQLICSDVHRVTILGPLT
jgi:predicted phage baseplate assembly protein